MQEVQTGPDLGRVKSGPRLGETTRFLYVEHQVAPVQVLHHEEQVGICLEGAEQVAEVRMPRGERQHFPLDQRAFHVVVFEDHVFLQAFHSVHTLGTTELGQQHLAETTFS